MGTRQVIYRRNHSALIRHRDSFFLSPVRKAEGKEKNKPLEASNKVNALLTVADFILNNKIPGFLTEQCPRGYTEYPDPSSPDVSP